MRSKHEDLLRKLGVIDAASVEELYPRVRDRDDVRVMICRRSGVIFTAPLAGADPGSTETAAGFEYWGASNRLEALRGCADDDRRRARQFETQIGDRRWLDFGTGVGGVLELLAGAARECWGVEKQPGPRESLVALGLRVVASLDEVPDDHFDVITLFHVLEHLDDPVDTLRVIHRKLRRGGTLLVEVPHARDFLISSLALDAFMRFTFWSEHLILHTRQSLETFLKSAGFDRVEIEGLQRYPLANHLRWLRDGVPGGHRDWAHLRREDLDAAYASLLASLDRTDTLVAHAIR
jgi:2-polyprenyl-3-methyl-5-hydroxy-6-metoxy-1,4-benzoquinol methylase